MVTEHRRKTKRYFNEDELILSATAARERATCEVGPSRACELYFPAMYRMQRDADYRDVYETVACPRPIGGGKVRPRGDCYGYMNRWSLAPVRIADLTPGGRYLIHPCGNGAARIAPSRASRKKTVALRYPHSTKRVRIYAIYGVWHR